MSNKSTSNIVGHEALVGILQKLDLLSKKGSRMTFALHGNPGSGKSALLNSTLADSMHFTASTIKTIEDLTQCIRKCVIVKIKEKNSVIKGEVLEIKPDRLVLKTNEMQSEFTIGKKMKHELIMEKVSAGDLIQIIKETGKITKLGKVFVKTHDFDVLGPDVKFVDCVEGNLVNVVETVNKISLYEFDFLNSLDIYGTKSICVNVRQQIDNKINDWVEEGLAAVEYRHMIIKHSEFLKSEFLDFLCERTNRFMPSICLVSDSQDFFHNEAIKGCLTIQMKEPSDSELDDIVRLHCQNKQYECDADLIEITKNYAHKTTIKNALKVLDIAYNQAQNDNTSNINQKLVEILDLIK